jgi:hypothetical protein
MGDCKAEDIPRNMFLAVALRYDIPARSGGTVSLEAVLYGKVKVRHHGSVALRVTAVPIDSGYDVFAIVGIEDNRMGEAIADCAIQQGCGFIFLDIVEHFFQSLSKQCQRIAYVHIWSDVYDTTYQPEAGAPSSLKRYFMVKQWSAIVATWRCA